LKEPCIVHDAPKERDYDVLLDWVTVTVLPELGRCASKLKKTVEAWPG
jgi:hypothetical protein